MPVLHSVNSIYEGRRPVFRKDMIVSRGFRIATIIRNLKEGGHYFKEDQAVSVLDT